MDHRYSSSVLPSSGMSYPPVECQPLVLSREDVAPGPLQLSTQGHESQRGQQSLQSRVGSQPMQVHFSGLEAKYISQKHSKPGFSFLALSRAFCPQADSLMPATL